MVKIDFVNAQEPAINDTNLNQMQLNIENAINAQVSGDTLPVGSIMPYGSDTVPENWLLCDGQAVSRTDYALLFSIIGTSYGVGDGSTTFNLPNLKGRVAVGKDSTQTEFDNLGETGGEKTHTLTVEEMPSHQHKDAINVGGSQTLETVQYLGGQSNAQYYVSTSAVGGSQPHNILQPYQVTNYIIKARQSAGLVATVVDGLNSTSTTDALSANQGRVLNENIQTLTPTVLYRNSTGVHGTVTLSDRADNYEHLEISFRVGNAQKSVIWKKHSTRPNVQLDFVDFSDNQLKFYTKTIYIDGGTTITNYAHKKYTIQNSTTWTPFGSDDNEIYIIAVLGYKY